MLEAADGELAYPLIKAEQPDIIISDIKMPFMERPGIKPPDQKDVLIRIIRCISKRRRYGACNFS